MPVKKVENADFRINMLLIFFVAGAVILAGKLFIIQVLSHEKYKNLAQEQYWDSQNITSKRGDLLSYDGFRLASTQTYYLLYVEPKKVTDKLIFVKKAVELLAEVKSEGDSKKKTELAGVFRERLDNIMSSDLVWAIVTKELNPEQKNKILEAGIEGLGVEEEPVRYYPNGTLAAHVLGFVASDESGQKVGYFGVEGDLDRELRGKDGKVLQEKGALGDPILLGGYKKLDPINGRDVVLTINRSVQYMVENKLKEGVEKYDAASGSVIVMNPDTGNVIAMANYPTYNPSVFNEEKKAIEDINETFRKETERRNLGISATYEPGSVMKPFTISSALDMGKIVPESTFNDEGQVKYSDYYIDNWNGQHHGVQNVIQLLQKSNNIGAAWVGHLVGARDLTDYLKKFGFGEKTNIELEGEDTGSVRDFKSLTDIDLANISFGQGISATPLQVLNGFNVFINGGELIVPRVVDKILDNEKEIEIPVKRVRRVVTKKTADTMIELLVLAVEGGEAKFFNTKNYKIGGKTGTAQIPFEGKYDPNKTNATFVGFFAGTRDISMIVRLEQPTNSIFAAETAVPLWMSIAEELANFYGITPDKEPSVS
ncbi:hypothetical protein A3F07_01035 [candidate division WWE3 bacterium RIFCSPHIGHO2_12_FULL_38_15]|uniref:Penicillin-binding protein transpeptidase domain-containing protein n=1 Tax=candidate division WWE3 bacterium RIFCSPHIGHO2_02_FULL_38_14 TaxID=1802620 RepID=A0A1F4VA75_UNCKA|nr:MAG: hypothetical protein A2793_03765 [candidate division WWE3 bacterium RIFCSPHIGHO2_01_FULL_38_45]OGC49159.1 MAG: hypothetical protein A3F07_01035 [candidate division WWE3 bacterium RIFCSPHIGHO2_12_FULL_38_15]OGC52575.1 MAG: hypothetical protein A3B64_03370 [candidate division WWE3 bacterium RIFCSPLOWO2_01_FULL_37_24]OGC54066.1 MAG: hypothetical protein A3D91_04895 [candidate division WWE3 bacterium RIFCSPHIGHO2_02_FULL_38_14]HLB51762.1 penicillin-binding protein 2 [Patescibacteria group b